MTTNYDKLIPIYATANATSAVNCTAFGWNYLATFNGYQYGVFWDENAQLRVYKRSLANDAVQIYATGKVVVNGQEYGDPNTIDPHNIPSIGVSKDGYLHIVFDQHTNPLRYIRSINPEDITTWTGEILMTGVDDDSVSYPVFLYTNSHEMYFAWRKGISGNGNWHLNHWNTATKAWEVVIHPFLKGTDGDPTANAYPNYICIDSQNRMMITWTWRDENSVPYELTNHDLCFAMSAPGDYTRWFKSTGEEYILPITKNNAEIIDAIPPYSHILNTQGMAVDSQDRPHIACLQESRYDNDPSNTTQIYHIYFDGVIGSGTGQWRKKQVTNRTHWQDWGLLWSSAGTQEYFQNPYLILRPAVVIDKNDKVYILANDVELGNGIAVFMSDGTDYAVAWAHEILYDASLNTFEPSFDPLRWKNDGILSMQLQVAAGPYYIIQDYPPQQLYVMEWTPPSEEPEPDPDPEPEPEPTPETSAISDTAAVGIQAVGGFAVGQWDGYPYGYQFLTLDSDPDLLIVYDEDGNPAAILDNASNVCIVEALNGEETLEFILPITDPKWAEIKGERYIRFQGKEWVIVEPGDKRDESGKLLSNIQCVINAHWELNSALNQVLELDTVSATTGLVTILDGTGWAVGQVDSTKFRSLGGDKANMQSVLYNAREWNKLHGGYLVFNSMSRVVDMVNEPGVDTGVQFRIGKNIVSVERRPDFRNLITRLWPFGNEDLSVNSVHPNGLSYIDNFQWYITQGYTTEQIYADITAKGKASKFLKEGVWKESGYVEAQALYDDAVARLAESSMPRVEYAFRILDLSSQTGYEHEAFSLGDTIRIIDEDLSIDTPQRIVRRRWYPFEPWRDEVELANRRSTIIDSMVQTARVIQTVERQSDLWGSAANKVDANFDAWMRAHNINEDGTFPTELLRGIWYAANSAIRAGNSESVIIDDHGLTIAEHTVVEDHGVIGAIGEFAVGSQAVGEAVGTATTSWKTDRYIRATGGAIVLCAGEGLPIRTAITPDGILAPAIMVDDDNPLASGDGFTFIGESGVQVVDRDGLVRAFLGRYDTTPEAEKWGLQILDGSFEIKTSASGARIELDLVGLRGVNASDQALFDLDAATGLATFKTAAAGSRVEVGGSGVKGYSGADLLFNLDAANGETTIKTAATGARIEFTPDMLAAFDGQGVETFKLLAADGSAKFKGSIESGSTIIGAIIKTATSGKRVEIDSGGIAGYDTSEVMRIIMGLYGGGADLTFNGASGYLRGWIRGDDTPINRFFIAGAQSVVINAPAIDLQASAAVKIDGTDIDSLYASVVHGHSYYNSGTDKLTSALAQFTDHIYVGDSGGYVQFYNRSNIVNLSNYMLYVKDGQLIFETPSNYYVVAG